jgi:hypothetical protein
MILAIQSRYWSQIETRNCVIQMRIASQMRKYLKQLETQMSRYGILTEIQMKLETHMKHETHA